MIMHNIKSLREVFSLASAVVDFWKPHVLIVCATFSLWSASFLLIYTFPTLNEYLRASGTFWLYGAICLLGFWVIYRKLPETKGNSLEQIEIEFASDSVQIHQEWS